MRRRHLGPRLRRGAVGLGLAVAALTVPSPALALNRPDLKITSDAVGPSEVSAGESIAIRDRTANVGRASAGPSTVRFYLSRDRARGNGDLRIDRSHYVPGLAAGTSFAKTVSQTVGSGIPPARYWLLACADDLRRVAESYENNNCRPTDTTVTVRAPGTLLAAGDIASCTSPGDEATAALLGRWPSAPVATLGDNAYEDGTLQQFQNCYQPSWGAAKARTRPSAGNREYRTAAASGYFGYFGTAAGDPTKGYYSYDVGPWHVVVLNSSDGCTQTDPSQPLSCAPTSAQVQWLRDDLAAHPRRCTLAYWHHPLFTSGQTSSTSTVPGAAGVKPFWDVLHAAGADVILNGHAHVYERWAPQAPDGSRDGARGLRELVVGTGGAARHTLGAAPANVEARSDTSFGVLKLDLRASSYSWQFVPADAGGYTDSGSASCH